MSAACSRGHMNVVEMLMDASVADVDSLLGDSGDNVLISAVGSDSDTPNCEAPHRKVARLGEPEV